MSKMSSDANRVLSDTYMMHYGASDMLKVYYTCFPSKDKKRYDCVKGQFDSCWSNTKYYEDDWKVITAPRIIPEKYHVAYLNFKNPGENMLILKK